MRPQETAWVTGALFLWALLLLSEAQNTAISSDTGSVKMTDEDRLLEELFHRRHYNPDSRPVISANDAIGVQIAIVPIQLAKIDDLNEVMQILVWMEMRWQDFRLAWNESDYGGLSRIAVRSSLLWSPDIVLINRAQQWNKWAEVNIVLSSDGVCDWFPPMMAMSYCPIDIQWFPFDEQRCSFEFESWSYDTSKLNLTAKNPPIVFGYYRRNSEWDLIEILSNDTTIHYPCCLYPSSHLKYTFHWRRRTLFYGFNLIMPCSLLSALSAVTYIIPPQSGERIGLGISTLLALSVNQLIVADRVPPTSDAIPLIGVYFACVMTVNAVSLMAMVAISNLYHRSSTNMYPLPDWVRTLICIRLGKLLRMPKPPHDNQEKQIKDCPTVKANQFNTAGNYNSSPPTDAEKEHSPGDDDIHDYDWKYAALVIDRLCFCFCTLYLTTITLAFYTCAFVIRNRVSN